MLFSGHAVYSRHFPTYLFSDLVYILLEINTDYQHIIRSFLFAGILKQNKMGLYVSKANFYSLLVFLRPAVHAIFLHYDLPYPAVRHINLASVLLTFYETFVFNTVYIVRTFHSNTCFYGC